MRADGRSAQARRVQEIDAVASILPMARCDRLAELLTEADIATLKEAVSLAAAKVFSGPALIAAQVNAHGLPAELTGAVLAGGGPPR